MPADRDDPDDRQHEDDRVPREGQRDEDHSEGKERASPGRQDGPRERQNRRADDHRPREAGDDRLQARAPLLHEALGPLGDAREVVHADEVVANRHRDHAVDLSGCPESAVRPTRVVAIEGVLGRVVQAVPQQERDRYTGERPDRPLQPYRATVAHERDDGHLPAADGERHPHPDDPQERVGRHLVQPGVDLDSEDVDAEGLHRDGAATDHDAHDHADPGDPGDRVGVHPRPRRDPLQQPIRPG